MTWTHDKILQAGHTWKDATGEFPAQHHWNPARCRTMVDSLMLRGALYELAAVSIAWMDYLDEQQARAGVNGVELLKGCVA